MQRIALILLAAGKSQRFGADKLLAMTADGQKLIDRTLATYRQPSLKKLSPIFVAVHQANSLLTKHIAAKSGWKIIPITGAERGLGLSIAQSVAFINERADKDSISGWMISLADMPCIRTETIMAMLDAYDGQHILQPKFNSADGSMVPGHPVIFPYTFTDQLLQLDEDTGGRDIIRRHAGSVQHILTTDQGVLLDVDTPSDLTRLMV